jgi:hypothetical protein
VRDQNSAPCSFNGRQHVRDRALEWRPAPAWEQKDMKLFLELYETHGARYTPPAFHSGYNEEGRTQIERMRGWMRRVLAGPPLMLLHICVLAC